MKPLLHIVKLLLSGNYQHGQFHFRAPHRLDKLISVHSRHHYIGYDKVYIFPVHKLKRFRTVRRGERAVAVVGQHRTEQLAHTGIVLRHKNVEHTATPYT